MKNFLNGRYRLALIPVAAAVLAACASAPANNRALDEARAFYQQAASDATVARSAPLELRRAQEALQQAEAALKTGDDLTAVDHYAYLARQRAAVAMQAGEIAKAEQAVAQSQAQRDSIVISARERDAQASRAQAEASRAQAVAKATEAERARQDAEAARKLAEQRLAAADAAKASNAKLKAQLAELQAQQTERGMVLTLGDVLFDSGRAELKSGAMRTIDQLVTFLKDNPERTVNVEGYTDSIGSDNFNLGLSQRRADAVRMALTSRGVEGTRIAARGYGESSPVASNDTAEGRQRNRRIEIVISNAK